MILFLRLTCLVFGHGEFKQYWKTLSPGCQTSEIRCEHCGAHK